MQSIESFVHSFASIRLSFCKDAFYDISATVFATKCNEKAKCEERNIISFPGKTKNLTFYSNLSFCLIITKGFLLWRRNKTTDTSANWVVRWLESAPMCTPQFSTFQCKSILHQPALDSSEFPIHPSLKTLHIFFFYETTQTLKIALNWSIKKMISIKYNVHSVNVSSFSVVTGAY